MPLPERPRANRTNVDPENGGARGAKSLTRRSFLCLGFGFTAVGLLQACGANNPVLPATAPVTSAPSPSPTPTSTRPPLSPFPIGLFEDANMHGGDAGNFETMIRDLKARGFNSVMLTNGSAHRDAPLLAVSDRLDVDVYLGPMHELWRQWWPDEFPASERTAHQVLAPLVDLFRPHSSLKGYYTIDEPDLGRREKVRIATMVLSELDPARLNFPLLVGLDRIGLIFPWAQPAVMLLDVYPFAYGNEVGDFTMRAFGYELSFADYVRLAVTFKPAHVPLWVVLQAHRFGSPDSRWRLREPTLGEVRAQHWLALAEGARGIFWFIYSSQQGWRGLADNPDLFGEVATLARRTLALGETLSRLSRTGDEFAVGGGHVTTLVDGDGRRYLIVVNRDCVAPRSLAVTSLSASGHLRDLETGRTYRLGQAVGFRAGDGRLFEFLPYRGT